MNLEKNLEKCLKVENTYKWIEILINRVDKLFITGKEYEKDEFLNIFETQTDVTKLPRYKKMMRLKKFYSNLVMFILITFQDYYYEDFPNQQTIPELMEDAFLNILKPFLRLKELFEEFVHNEFPDEQITDLVVGDLKKK